MRVVEYKGRCKKPYTLRVGDILSVADDEANDDTFIVICKKNNTNYYLDPAYLELVTPAEEAEPFYVCENTESKSFEVRRKENHKVQAAFYYFSKDDTHAKREAAKATLEHCDRLNAEYRKEQK